MPSEEYSSPDQEALALERMVTSNHGLSQLNSLYFTVSFKFMQSVAHKIKRYFEGLDDFNTITPILGALCDSTWLPTETDMNRLKNLYGQVCYIALPKLHDDLELVIRDTREYACEMDITHVDYRHYHDLRFASERKYEKYRNVLGLGYFYKRKFRRVEKKTDVAESRFCEAKRNFSNMVRAITTVKDLVGEVHDLVSTIENTLSNGMAISMNNGQQD